MKNKKKVLLIAIPIALFVVFSMVYYRLELLAFIGIKPRIKAEYVCSDICTKEDIKKVYEGVTDMDLCKRIGGTPYTYYGWGEYHACLAE